MLKAGPRVIYERLSNHEGTDNMGNTSENREWVLGWKEWWENKVIKKQGVTVVNADDTLINVAGKIIKLVE